MQQDQGGGPRPQHEMEKAAIPDQDREDNRAPVQNKKEKAVQRPPARGKDPKQGGRGAKGRR